MWQNKHKIVFSLFNASNIASSNRPLTTNVNWLLYKWCTDITVTTNQHDVSTWCVNIVLRLCRNTREEIFWKNTACTVILLKPVFMFAKFNEQVESLQAHVETSSPYLILCLYFMAKYQLFNLNLYNQLPQRIDIATSYLCFIHLSNNRLWYTNRLFYRNRERN